MTNEELAKKMVSRVDFMIIQHMPRPTCSSKYIAWQAKVTEVKKLIAAELYPNANGITITL